MNNKDILKEIHRSKNSYCEYTSPIYADYDIIINNLEDALKEVVQTQAKLNRSIRLAESAYEAQLFADINKIDNVNYVKPKLSEFKFDHNTILIEDLVFRVMTYDHIPVAPGRKKNPKTDSDKHARLNFLPFKHYILRNNTFVEVGRSHSKNGKFSVTSGNITNTLTHMYITLIERYSQRPNWRNYSYLDEMKAQALIQLIQMGLRFNEARGQNPFAYYTQTASASFTRVFNLEKKQQEIRDDLLMVSGASPSLTKQLSHEEDVRLARESALDNLRDY